MSKQEQKRIIVAKRHIQEFFSGERLNPRLCLTEIEAEKIMMEDSVYLRKCNCANKAHEPVLYMYKIIAR